MKKSLTHLPKSKQKDLRYIAKYVLEALQDDCEMIILFGSYARGNYVDYDQRIEYGVPTYFMSDYDILVLTSKRINSPSLSRICSKVANRYYNEKGNARRAFTTSIQFIHEPIDNFNKAIGQGRYFYTDVKREGILLYDSKRHKLARRKKQNYREIRELALEYYTEKFGMAIGFLKGSVFYHHEVDYRMASFMLHQACENLYRAIILTYTLYGDKTHDLEELMGMAKIHTLEVSKAFPRDTQREQQLFQLLNDAYIQARYNPKFAVSKQDIEELLPLVELLRDITKQVCEARIEEYAAKARAGKRKPLTSKIVRN